MMAGLPSNNETQSLNLTSCRNEAAFSQISEARMVKKYCSVVVKWNDATYLAAFIERLDFLVEIY